MVSITEVQKGMNMIFMPYQPGVYICFNTDSNNRNMDDDLQSV